MAQGLEGTAKCRVQLIPSGQAPTAIFWWSSPLGWRWGVEREDCPTARNERRGCSGGEWVCAGGGGRCRVVKKSVLDTEVVARASA